ncbi:hypothetical protein tinsulaeT_37110 [Thalassotalea insulae]|uniref:Uncharacterized protein n=1 Tax=Thalassotalea insulae TaxID=2056778 RepID=A0ABQ6H0H1_9GAMM|nr:hypothetical protein [Thalassotalea insulae]GLX80371.1 hypothetical protein tinsulaeT_37110 [Thalassotalea insulae]
MPKLGYGRQGKKTPVDKVADVYETEIDARKNQRRATGTKKTRSYEVHRPVGRRGSFFVIHGHENFGKGFERKIGREHHDKTYTAFD